MSESSLNVSTVTAQANRLYPRLVVLKFGGSVLRCAADIDTAALEIRTWTRRGWKVVAVVSALEGTTDALIARADAIGASRATDPHSRALLLATGELTSAALLGLTLSTTPHGVKATVAEPSAIGLTADAAAPGSALDAMPTSLSPVAVHELLREHDAVVIPGFIGVDASDGGRGGRTVLLGRGGSDLTALFIADRLKAHCVRLVKDVDGLYEFDPALSAGVSQPSAAPASPPPRRYSAISWDDALTLVGEGGEGGGGGIVQDKAIRFARDRGLSFEVGESFAGKPTVVGPGPSVLEPASVRSPVSV